MAKLMLSKLTLACRESCPLQFIEPGALANRSAAAAAVADVAGHVLPMQRRGVVDVAVGMVRMGHDQRTACGRCRDWWEWFGKQAGSVNGGLCVRCAATW